MRAIRILRDVNSILRMKLPLHHERKLRGRIEEPNNLPLDQFKGKGSIGIRRAINGDSITQWVDFS